MNDSYKYHDFRLDLFFYYKDLINRALDKSSVYDLQDEFLEDEHLTEDQRDELEEISYSRLNFLDEVLLCRLYK